MHKTAFSSIFITVLFLSLNSFAMMDCRAIVGKTPSEITIHDVLNVKNDSRIQYNGKLVMAGLYQVLETHYGPLNYKPASVKINWDNMKAEGLKAVGTFETTNDLYYGIANFLFRFNDAHVSVELPSTLKATLPLQITTVGSKLVMNFVSNQYPKNLRQPGIADEVIAINDMSPKEFQKLFPGFNADGNEVTNYTLFAHGLSRWSEARGMPLSHLDWKDIKLTLRSYKDKNDIYDIRVPLTWEGIGLIGKDIDGKDPSPKPIVIPAVKQADKATKLAPKTLMIVEKAHKLMRTENTRLLREGKEEAEDEGIGQKIVIGSKKPFFKLPDNFKELKLPLMMKVPPLSNYVDLSSFYVGTFERNGKQVGFLRIPEYSMDSMISMATTIRYIIGRLEAETDYLVIDQTNNPGGMVIMSDMILKSLMGKYDRSKHMRFAVKPTESFLRQYAEMIEEIKKNEDNLFSDAELKSIVDELNIEYSKIRKAQVEGRDLSEPISMLAISEYVERSFDKALFGLPLMRPLLKKTCGIDLSQHQTYTKDVFFMINELDFSGGDATPAGFDDYGRGTLVGTLQNTKTAGAGGTVEEFSIRSVVEMVIHLTTSLMVRLKDRLVENQGVTAQLNVPIAQDDIANGYTTYFDRVMQNIEKHLSQSRTGH